MINYLCIHRREVSELEAEINHKTDLNSELKRDLFTVSVEASILQSGKQYFKEIFPYHHKSYFDNCNMIFQYLFLKSKTQYFHWNSKWEYVHMMHYVTALSCKLEFFDTYRVLHIQISLFMRTHKRRYLLERPTTGCNDTLAPLPQIKLNVAQYNQTYCRKVKSISAMDFQYFCFVSIFASFLYSQTKMLKFTNTALKVCCLFAFSSPCMDSME